jgi:phage terminase small subunit
MPRKSRAELHLPMAAVDESIPIHPPATLSRAARATFVDLVVSCEVGHFEAADVTLLGQYCEAAALAARSASALQAGDAGQLAVWEKATRAMSGLALRLRLGPQARREKAKVPKSLDFGTRFALEQQHGKARPSLKPWDVERN